MAIATRYDSQLVPTITQATLISALLNAFTDAGYSAQTANFTSGTDRILVYEFPIDTSKTFGTNFIRIRITSTLQVFQQIFTAWNTVNNTGSNGSTEINLGTLVTNVQVNFCALNGAAEYKLVLLTQGTLFIPLGILAPQNRPTWWDLNSWSWGFIATTASMNVWRSSLLNPYNNAEFDTFLNSSRMSNPNPQTNRRELLTGLMLLTQSNTGVAGRTSDDLASASASGSGRYDVLALFGSNQKYLLLVNVAGGLAIRIE
jgi:hypothetical protein